MRQTNQDETKRERNYKDHKVCYIYICLDINLCLDIKLDLVCVLVWYVLCIRQTILTGAQFYDLVAGPEGENYFWLR